MRCIVLIEITMNDAAEDRRKERREDRANKRKLVCQHCHTRKAHRTSRMLCGRCYDNKGVRYLYPVERVSFTKEGLGLKVAVSLVGWEPTEALPGTEEKIVVLQDRASKGLPLWHPKDARLS